MENKENSKQSNKIEEVSFKLSGQEGPKEQ